MRTARERSQDEQYRVAKEALDTYARVLERFDTLRITETRSHIRALDEAIRLIEEAEQRYSAGSARTQALMRDAIEAQQTVRANFEEQRANHARELDAIERSSESFVEILINQSNGATDLLLPVKKDDLQQDTLAHKLYTYCRDFCDGADIGRVTEKTFDGYVVLSIDARLERQSFARQLLDEAPPEFGGSRTGTLVYVRVAYNFCFTYTAVPEQNVSSSEAPSPSHPQSQQRTQSQRTISKAEAIVEFDRGKNAKDIYKQHSGTPVMTIAGWQSAWRKGQYRTR